MVKIHFVVHYDTCNICPRQYQYRAIDHGYARVSGSRKRLLRDSRLLPPANPVPYFHLASSSIYASNATRSQVAIFPSVVASMILGTWYNSKAPTAAEHDNAPRSSSYKMSTPPRARKSCPRHKIRQFGT